MSRNIINIPHDLSYAVQLARKILSMQNIECETLGSLENMFRSDSFQIENINAQKDHVPASAKGYSAVVKSSFETSPGNQLE